MNYRNVFIALATISAGITASAQAAESATVAFLMPDQASTRYEQHDFPGFKAEMSKLCADCKVIYQNANASATLQQQQFNSVIAQGAKNHRSRSGGLFRRRCAGRQRPGAGCQSDRLRSPHPGETGRFLRLV
ncbi:ABC-type xylose transport system, periplasmic component [Raoultella terrigena]|uniref:ABC-type xylose transport system, periplasmic component n=1 Tax=Raoultella terrigena TaxID=577 RepID=A0A4V6J1W1_RAOTE|nr:ABC-type xylose transport system, periplasmic component [Raoultella terrigena]